MTAPRISRERGGKQAYLRARGFIRSVIFIGYIDFACDLLSCVNDHRCTTRVDPDKGFERELRTQKRGNSSAQ